MLAKKKALAVAKRVKATRHTRQRRKGRTNPIQRDTIDKIESWEKDFQRRQRMGKYKLR